MFKFLLSTCITEFKTVVILGQALSVHLVPVNPKSWFIPDRFGGCQAGQGLNSLKLNKYLKFLSLIEI
uniref:Uncharacterized protein n=1 Tax=Romanomermis culicivorax TaxID=13658 RepID=A0A915LD79_ROMCU